MSERPEVRNIPFRLGMYLTVGGVVNSNATRFSINLCPSDDSIGMHIDHRFSYGADQNVLVLNSLVHNVGWQQEERSKKFPFSKGQSFQTTITFDTNTFYIELSNGETVEFPNRSKDEVFNVIYLAGDARLTYVRLE
ncbi:hypothetical protein COCON_G00024530 [Conger conger]|uniref:Galectin n=1 Tax=Conger conger TaxID=82655 RepID=A0A9Q1I6L1_CONCO|nr:congerin-2 [Conger conger]KAJ8283603.1 hypothetical protein COCON_G00024530 [Conger conger]